MLVSNAEVEIPIAQNRTDMPIQTDGQGVPEADTHASEQGHDSMSDMDMGESESETTEMSTHDEEITDPMAMAESHEHGVYVVETHLESSGEHEVQVMFHVNGEMLQADFMVDVPGISSKTIILWSFLTVNVGLIAFAGVLKKQPVSVKGGK
jgi:hypothetical protein